MKQDENDQNHKKEATPVVGKKPYGKSQVNIKIRSSAYILGICLVLLLAIFYVIKDRFADEDEVVVPYEKISEFRQDIADLPIIGVYSTKVSDDDWRRYELVAKRIRISNSELI